MGSDGKGMGMGKMCCLCCCASCCCVVVALAVAIGVIAASFEEPTVDVKGARFSRMDIWPSNVTFTISVGVHVSNPNGWPIEGTIESLNAHIFSLDKHFTDPALLMGEASLPSPVTIAAESETDFNVSASVVIKSDSAELYGRIVQDCGLTASPDPEDGRITTKLRILLLDTVLKVMDTTVDLSGFEIPLETLVDCRDTSSMQQQLTIIATTPAAPPTTLPAPSPGTTLPLVR